MKIYETASIRNVAIVGHGGSGKTSLTSEHYAHLKSAFDVVEV